MDVNTKISEEFGDKIRIRACGILIIEDKLLLVKHVGLGPEGVLWAPPGGGVHFGESIGQALKRELVEETGLDIKVNKFLGLNEFIKPPLHAVELFYEISTNKAQIVKGKDPELKNVEIIDTVDLLTWDQFKTLPSNHLHSLLLKIGDFQDLLKPETYC